MTNKQRRLALHETFVQLLGSNNVYFQPPSTVKMKYPCIVYGRRNDNTIYADDSLYTFRQGYNVMVIDPDPDSELPDKIRTLSSCGFDRHYTADNLNHDVFNIYY